MATTTATVIPQGLALTPDFMAQHDLTPGTSVTVTVGKAPRKLPAHIEQLIEETCGMFAGTGPSMAEELIVERREEERRFNEKWNIRL